MNLAKIIKKDLICYLKARRKDEALEELIEILRVKNMIKDSKQVKELILQREELMSTGIGIEIGVPHVRMEGIKKPIIIVGIAKDGIMDYMSLDDKPVKLIMMVLVGKGAHKEYIQILAQIATKLKDDNIREKIINSKDREEILNCFR